MKPERHMAAFGIIQTFLNISSCVQNNNHLLNECYKLEIYLFE